MFDSNFEMIGKNEVMAPINMCKKNVILMPAVLYTLDDLMIVLIM